MVNENKIGVAIQYPIKLENGAGTLATGNEVIQQSITDILSTDSSSFFYGEFKSKLKMLTFEQNDNVLQTLLRMFIFEALTQFEKRIKVKSVDFQRGDEGFILCKIDYRVIGETKTDSFIYPFYQNLAH